MNHDALKEEDGLYLDQVHSELSRLLKGPGHLQAGITYLNREFQSAAHRPAEIRAHLAFNAGVLTWAGSDAVGALEWLRESVTLEPTNPQGYLATVYPLIELGRLPEALAATAHAKDGIAADSFWQHLEPQVVGYEGVVLLAMGNVNEALRRLDSLEAGMLASPESTVWCDLQLAHAISQAGCAPERLVAYVARVADRASQTNDLDLARRLKPLQQSHGLS